MAGEPAPRGHSTLPHTADALIEAWAPTPAGCYEEAVAAFVTLFADTRGRAGAGSWTFDLGPGTPEDLLVMLLEEVLLAVETAAVVPVGAAVEVRDDRVTGHFDVVAATGIGLVGSIPKGVSYHLLRFGRSGPEWRCRATVDV